MSGKICPKLNGQVVCMECCMKCEHYFKNEVYISHGCRYGADRWHEQTEKKETMIKRIDAQILDMERKAEYFYNTDRPGIARKYEGKISRLRYEKAELMAD